MNRWICLALVISLAVLGTACNRGHEKTTEPSAEKPVAKAGDPADSDPKSTPQDKPDPTVKDEPKAVHILLVGPLEARIQYLARREGCSQDEATKRVSELDGGRFDFHHKFFKIDVNDPAVYHAAINTTKFPDDDAAEIIVDLTSRIAAWPKAQ